MITFGWNDVVGVCGTCSNVPHLVLFSEVGGGWMHCRSVTLKDTYKIFVLCDTMVSINSISNQGRTGAFVMPTRPTKKFLMFDV